MQVHPAADLFPMMSEDELQELAADIQSRGLRHPIMLDHTGKVLIDGRNRLAACELLKQEPTFARLDKDDDPIAYIISINVRHRHLTKGQQAMAVAMAYPEPGKRGPRKKGDPEVDLVSKSFSTARLSQARSVLKYSRPLAQEVMSGDTPLNEAVEIVRQHEQRFNSKEAQLERLRSQAPDLADLVSEERLVRQWVFMWVFCQLGRRQ
jgi:hypothetical protein